MDENKTRLKLIGLIMELEESLDTGKRDAFWYNNKFDSLMDESLIGLEFKYRMLKKQKETKHSNK